MPWSRAGHIQSGDTVLIQGTGGVSCFALQFAKALGARVIGTSSSAEKAAPRRQNWAWMPGTTTAIDPEWARWAIGPDGGRGVDLTVEVGGAGNLPAVPGGHPGGRDGRPDRRAQRPRADPRDHPYPTQNAAHTGNLRGLAAGSFEEMNRAITQTGMRPVVDRVFSFGEAREAFRDHGELPRTLAKIVISVTSL